MLSPNQHSDNSPSQPNFLSATEPIGVPKKLLSLPRSARKMPCVLSPNQHSDNSLLLAMLLGRGHQRTKNTTNLLFIACVPRKDKTNARAQFHCLAEASRVFLPGFCVNEPGAPICVVGLSEMREGRACGVGCVDGVDGVVRRLAQKRWWC